jgi:hypothetical protein
VAARPAAGAGWAWWWVGVAATVGSQPHQHHHGDLGKVQGRLGRVVAAVEHKPRHGPAGRQPLQERAELYGGGVVGVVQRVQAAGVTGAVQESRPKPSCAVHWNAQPAMVGWPAECREGW